MIDRKRLLFAAIGLVIGAGVVLLVGLAQIATFDIFRP